MRLQILVAIIEAKTKRRRAKLLLALMSARTLVRERNFLVTAALVHPLDSPWHRLYASGDRGSFIATVSLPPEAFQVLLAAFSRHYIVRSGPGRPGRPTKFVFKHSVLACLLHFYTAAVENKTLSEIFGVPPSTLSRALCKAELALDGALAELHDAQIRYPSKRKQEMWAMATEEREPLVKGVWGFVDGKNYRVQEPSDADLQNAHYNGWLHAVLVTGTLCFGVDGTIVWGKHNCPGSWNDGETSRALQLKLGDASITVPATGLAADSAFPVLKGSCGKIVTPLKDGDLQRAQEACRYGMVAMSHAITSLRQAAEWGMGAPSKCYRKLQLPLPFDPTTRGRRLRNIYRLYNFRVRRSCISQIRSLFGV